ncbi:hypothetical protein glysoja_044684, partial [Glycine soja]
MNILSYNIRGLGRGVKWPAIRKLITQNQVDLLCIQETKKEKIERALCQALWGDTTLSWEIYPAINSAGGLLCIWNDSIRALWASIRQLKQLQTGGIWCILGDFNSIRHLAERMTTSQRQGDPNSKLEFNDWISALEVEEVPCLGRKFTWIRPNGTAKSKLDRAKIVDWGPKPFRVLDCW